MKRRIQSIRNRRFRLLLANQTAAAFKPSNILTATLNPQHPLAKNLVAAFLCDGNTCKEVVSGQTVNATGGIISSTVVNGESMSTFPGSSYFNFTPVSAWSNGIQTRFYRCRLTSTANYRSLMYMGMSSFANRSPDTYFDITTGNFNEYLFTGNGSRSVAFSVPVNALNTISVDYSSTDVAANFNKCVNGVYTSGQARTGSATGADTVTVNTAVIGARPAGAQGFVGDISCIYLFNTRLTQAQHESLHANPWQMFQGPQLIIATSKPSNIFATALNTNHELYPSLAASILCSGSTAIDLVTGEVAAAPQGNPGSMTQGGEILSDFSSGTSFSFAHTAKRAITGNLSIFSRVYTTAVNNGGIVIKGNAVVGTAYNLQNFVNGLFFFRGATGGNAYKGWQNANLPSINAFTNISYDFGATVSDNANQYMNGAQFVITPGGGAGGTGTDPITDNGSPLLIGRRADTGVSLAGGVSVVHIFNTRLTPEQHQSLNNNPWQLYLV